MCVGGAVGGGGGSVCDGVCVYVSACMCEGTSVHLPQNSCIGHWHHIQTATPDHPRSIGVEEGNREGQDH